MIPLSKSASRQQRQRRRRRAGGPIAGMNRVAAAGLAPMLAEECPGRGIEQADVVVVPLDGDLAPEPARRRGVVGAGDFDAAVEMHGPGAVLVVANGPRGSGRRWGCSSANIAATWRLVVPWMRVSAQRASQRSR